MQRLEDMTLGHRVVLSVAIVLVILLLAACVGYLGGRWQTDAAPVPLMVFPPRHEKRLLELERIAIEEAYKAQIQHLFEVWMKDNTGQPGRAVTGANTARKAYAGAIESIERREDALKAREANP